MTPSMRVETSAGATGGGILRGLKRMLAGESFFNNRFTATADDQTLILAPRLTGDIVREDINQTPLIVQSGSWLAHTGNIQLDTKWGGLKGFLGGEGLFFIKLSGEGSVLINSFGAIHRIDVDGSFVVDTGHIVAFEETLGFRITRVGGWFATFFSGEGLVCRFEGRGRLWIQSRNPSEFGKFMGVKLPPREE